MSSTTSPLSILKQLQARVLLADFPIVENLDSIRAAGTYKGMEFVDYVDKLQNDLSSVPHMALWADVEPGTVGHYQVELTLSHEEVIDGLSRVEVDANAFLSRVKTVHQRALVYKGPFQVMWALAAAELIENSPLKKLGAKDISALAAMEFSTFLGERDLEWAAVIETTSVLLANIKAAKKLSAEKYAMGKDQINAALSGLDDRDRGMGGVPSATRQGDPGRMESLRGLFGDRVQSPVVPGESDDDLPAELQDPAKALNELDEEPLPGPGEPGFSGVADPEEVTHAFDAEAGETQDEPIVMGHPGPDIVLTPEGSKPVGDLQVGDKVLVLESTGMTPGVAEVAAIITPEAEAKALPDLVKPKKGEALVVPFNLNTQAPGTLHVPDFLIGKGKTKFQLTGQDNPAENGLYRFMGPDAPLAPLDEVASLPAKVVVTDTPTTTLPDPVPPIQPTIRETILNDPFLGTKAAEAVLAQIDAAAVPAGDDLPPEDDMPPEEPATTQVSGDDLPPEEDEIGPSTSPEATITSDDDDLPPEGDIVNSTQDLEAERAELGAETQTASEDTVEEAQEAPAPEEASTPETAPEPEPVPAPEPQKVQVATALQQTAPLPPTPPRQGLFRPRVQAGGPPPAPTFQPKTVSTEAVTTDDLGEVL